MPAFADDIDFWLDNQSSGAVTEVYVSALDSDSWEEDVPHRHVLLSGESAEITIEAADDTCDWDVRIVYDDGSYTDERDIDLCGS